MNNAEVAAQVGLLTLPKMGPARASWLLADQCATEVLAHLRAGRLPPPVGPSPPGMNAELVQGWIRAARALDERILYHDCERLGLQLVTPDDPSWPLASDPDPPVLLFADGRVELLADRPAVAIVGTRRCSAIGRSVASRFGAELAEAGVTVVSGLASGIDGAAHEGALSAGRGGALAVVGSGLDVVYPKVNAGLWRRVATDGLVISEAPPGARPERWRFPARNRLIAALADVVVVVESHAAGGSLLTVGEAAERGVTVMAAPGAVTNPAAAGSNQLLLDGAPPACSSQDILDQLPVPLPAAQPTAAEPAPAATSESGFQAPPGPPLSTLAQSLLRELGAGAVHLDELLVNDRESILRLLAAADELERHGLAFLDGSTLVGAAPSSSHKK